MNIAVQTFSGKVIVRPDTTRVKDGEDVYMPEYVSRLEWSPVLYTKIIKSGRSVGEKFADRYFDSFNIGALLYPSDLIDGSEEGYACASCLDHTSILNLQFFDIKSAEKPDNKIVISNNNNVLYSNNVEFASIITKSIVEITKYCWLRVGDLLAVELRRKTALCDRQNSPFTISGSLNGKTVFDTRIIF